MPAGDSRAYVNLRFPGAEYRPGTVPRFVDSVDGSRIPWRTVFIATDDVCGMYEQTKPGCLTDDVMDALSTPTRRHLLFKLLERTTETEDPELRYRRLPRFED